MSQPVDGKELYLYLAALATTVSTTLVRLDGDGKQKPVYFVSKMLIDVETQYTDFQRITLALRMVVKKLRPYFQVHTVVVLTIYPIRAILHKLDASGRLIKWAVELSEFDIEYRPGSAIKCQILANFITEMSDVQARDLCEMSWILETDSSSRAVGGGVGMVLQSPEGLPIAQAVMFAFAASNNKVEYKVVLLGLRLVKELSVTNLELWCDS